MAWAEKLPSGKWRGCWRDPAGNQHHTRRPEFPEHPYAKKREAVDAAQEAEVAARRQAAIEVGTAAASMTWGDWWTESRTVRADTDTAAVEDNIAKVYLTPKWGEVPLNTISQRDVKAWVADLLAGREVSYARRIYGVFRASMNRALDKEVLSASPCVGIKLPKVPKRRKVYVEEEHLAVIAPHLKRHYRDVIDFGMETGLRPGELGGLHADTLDLDTGWMTVSKVLVSRKGVIRLYPKDEDVRYVPLTEEAIRIAKRLLADRDLKAGCGVPHTAGKACKSALVFQNPNGDPIKVEAWWKAMKRAADKVGVESKTPYAVRRGFATRAARGGMDAFELAEILGHADVKQTQEYVQQTNAARDRMRAALGEAPRLTIVQGHAGAAEPDSGAASGADLDRRSSERTGKAEGENTG